MKTLMLVLLLGITAACSRREQPVDVLPTPTTAPPSTPPPPPNNEEASAAEAARREAERRRRVLEERVHFEFDRSDITDDARAILDRKLPILNGDNSIAVRIEGHADERGSVEYNLALSLRRAHAVRAYLAGGGVGASRMEVVAFGEEQPVESGSNESAWAVNRRAEFRLTGGF